MHARTNTKQPADRAPNDQACRELETRVRGRTAAGVTSTAVRPTARYEPVGHRKTGRLVVGRESGAGIAVRVLSQISSSGAGRAGYRVATRRPGPAAYSKVCAGGYRSAGRHATTWEPRAGIGSAGSQSHFKFKGRAGGPTGSSTLPGPPGRRRMTSRHSTKGRVNLLPSENQEQALQCSFSITVPVQGQGKQDTGWQQVARARQPGQQHRTRRPNS